MDDKFAGKWKMTTPFGEGDNFDAYHVELGTEKAVLDKFRNVAMETNNIKEGEGKWSVEIIIDGKVVKTYKTEFNKEEELDGMDGLKYKVISKMDGEAWVDDTCPCTPGKKEVTHRRTVSGDTMKVVSTIKGSGIKSSYMMKKVS